ncbi:MAG: carbamoyltransferase [Deltaproteobacteria bacterium]|nr:carbamoyltransferase [Deltaproteobacteria bacterium]
MIILGLSSYHPDASAALIVDGEIIAAVDEERLNRIKHSPGFPELAIKYCLEKGRISLDEVDYIAVANELRANLRHKIAFSLSTFPMKAWPEYFRNYMRQRVMKPLSLTDDLVNRVGGDPRKIRSRIRRVEHHNAHAASSYYTSPFNNAAIMSMDGSGDFVTCAMSGGRDKRIERLAQTYWPNSLGMLYFSVTQYLGFHELGAEGKIMALASYGKPKYMDEFRKIIRLTRDAFRMEMDYFTFHLPVLIDNWGDPAFHLLRTLHKKTHTDDLCLAGGVALNCVMNGRVAANTDFKRVFVQPNAGDGGLSLGSAFYLYHNILSMPRKKHLISASLGTEFTNTDVQAALEGSGLKYTRHDDIAPRVASRIADGRVIGWFQGKMEFGPRALGNRSILADPRRADMRDFINSVVKHRELFRPFAPSVLEEDARDFFDLNGFPSPFMLLAVDVRPDRAAQVPAITHVDGTARVQTVDRESNPRYRRLIEEFKKLTGIPMVLNTSFNLKGEPVVSSPSDAIKSFLATKIDVLAIEDYIVEKR